MTQERIAGVSYGYSPAPEHSEENRFLKENVETLKRELEKFRRAPLIAADVREVHGDKALIRLANGNEFLVEIAAGLQLKPGESVLAEQKNLTLVKKLGSTKRFDVERFVIIEKPGVSWAEIGGLDDQMREVREVIELPLLKPEVFKRVGIKPPKGILLHGEPGTGKTLLAKAVAASTKSTFIEVVGSELVQKFIGEGAKLVHEIFELARERAPSIVFIDELDAIAATRIDLGTSGEREVQRTFMQLLSEIDGFGPLDNVKVIGCTNRRDILDPAVIRPGRLDRLIHVPLPVQEGRKEILAIHTANMSLGKIDLHMLSEQTDGFSGADLHALSTEAGYCAIRVGRNKVLHKDFESALDRLSKPVDDGYKRMFG